MIDETLDMFEERISVLLDEISQARKKGDQISLMSFQNQLVECSELKQIYTINFGVRGSEFDDGVMVGEMKMTTTTIEGSFTNFISDVRTLVEDVKSIFMAADQTKLTPTLLKVNAYLKKLEEDIA